MSGNKKNTNKSSRIPTGQASVSSVTNGNKRNVFARGGGDGVNSGALSSATVQLTMENGRTVKIRGVTAEQLRAAVGGSMSAEDAATYIHVSSSSSPSSCPTGDSTGNPNGNVSFGPVPPPSMSSKRSNPSNNSSARSSMDYSSMAAAMMAGFGAGSRTGSSLSSASADFQAWKEKAAKPQSGRHDKSGSVPCTEDEMKALMGMFMEIMGMSMNGTANTNGSHEDDTSKAGSPSSAGTSKAGPYFSFGDGSLSSMTPESMGAAAAAAAFFPDGSSWEALRRTYAAAEQMAATDGDDEASDDDDDNEDDDHYDDNRELTFEEVEFLLQQRKLKEGSSKVDSRYSSGQWESLEQVSMDEDLTDTDAKERKAGKKREKKNRRKEKQKEEAARKAMELEQKKREKATMSWRSRVVSAAQANDTAKLEALLKESPLRKPNERESSMHLSNAGVTAHFEFLLPNTVPKNRASVERGAEARLRLARFVLDYDVRLAFEPLRTGRTAFHTASFYGDLQFVELVLEKAETCAKANGKELIPDEYFDTPCVESGWSPLHYAAISGSTDVMERLLRKGCNVSTTTDPTHTWKKSDGKGITPRELVEMVKSGRHEKGIETHGVALQEISHSFLSHHQDRREFVKKLERVHFRLMGIEKNGYSLPPETNAPIQKDATVSEANIADEANVMEGLSSRNKKKRKKKRSKGGNTTDSPDTTKEEAEILGIVGAKVDTKTQKVEHEDPLVLALLGMGFERGQIEAAIQGCGGSDRATADDVVIKILGQGSDNNEDVVMDGNDGYDEEDGEEKKELKKGDYVDTQKNSVATQESAEELEREAARKLEEKREEARRRNREWNMREQARQEQQAKEKVVKKAVQQILVAPRKVPPPGGTVPMQGTVPHLAFGLQPPTRYSHMRPPGFSSQIERNAPEMLKTSQWHSSPIAPRGPQSYPTAIPENADILLQPPGPPTSGSIASGSHHGTLYDDDRTVSSFGSNRGLSVASREFVPANFTSTPPILSSQTPPPGFMPATAQPVAIPVKPKASLLTSPALPMHVQNGEIRATAKAFVPSRFSQTNEPSSHRHADDAVSSLSNTGLQNNPVFSPSLLSHTSASVAPVSKVGHSFPTSFDPVLAMTPVSEDSTITGSSLLSGLSAEEPSLPIPVSFRGTEAKSSSGFLGPIPGSGSVGGSSIWGDSGNQSIPSVGSTLSESFFSDEKEPLGSKNRPLWGLGSEKVTQGSIW